jgi:ABC-2 type transport system permease protein
VRAQWLVFARSRTSVGAIAALALLSACSVVNGSSGVTARRRAAETLAADHRATLERIAARAAEDEARVRKAGLALDPARQGGRHPVTVLLALADFYASYPPSPAAMLGSPRTGIEPETYRLRAFDDDFVPAFPTYGDKALAGLIPERPIEHPRVPIIGRIDLGFFTLYVLPLAVLALAFDVPSADRDAGTFSLVLANPVRREWIVAAGAIVRVAPVVLTGLVVPVIAAIMVARQTAGVLDVRSAALWALAALTYVAFWLALSLAVNALGRSAAVTAALLATAYIGVVLVVPSAASLTARVIAPVPSRLSVAEAEREARFEALGPLSGAQDAIVQDLRRRFPLRAGDESAMARYRRAAWEEEFDLPTDVPLVAEFASHRPGVARRMTAMRLRQTLHAIRADFIESRLSTPLAAIAAARARASRIVTAFAMASPALALSAALEDLSGTGAARRNRFMQQLDAYARGIRGFVYPSLFAGVSIAPAALSARQPFSFDEEPLRTQYRRVASRLLVPAIETLGLLAVAFIGLRRLRA